MTDKTKPWFGESHEEFAPADEARHRLYASLSDLHEKINGTGVGVTADNQNPQIRLYVGSEEDAALLPKEFEGYEVFAVVTNPVFAH